MNCIEARAKIQVLLDGELSSRERRELGAHLVGCAACARHERSLDAMAETAAALPASIEPPRDLWPEIDRRIDALEHERSAPATTRRPLRPWMQVAAAAVLFASLTGGGLLLLRRVTGVEPSAPQGSRPTVVSADRSTTTREITEAERAFGEVKRRLYAALEDRRDTLSPETAASVDRNLRMIEQAIAEIGSALKRDPASPELKRMLIAARQREIALLRHVTQRTPRL